MTAPVKTKSTTCRHQPPCPSANATDHDAARVVVRWPEQGWSLLCNGTIVFDDQGEITPWGGIVPPPRQPALHSRSAA